MNEAEDRKRTLIAECDMNRARLSNDLNALIGQSRTLVSRSKSVSTLVSVAVTLLDKYLKRGQAKPACHDESSGWGHSAIDAVSLASSVWTAMHPHHQSPEDAHDSPPPV